MVEASLPAVATLLPVAEVLASFLRSSDAAESVQVCTTLVTPPFRDRCTAAAREAERNNDIRELAARRRAERRARWETRREWCDTTSEFDSGSPPSSLGFSIDSDGNWHEHDR